jgi:hypothetical protein
MTLIDKVYNWVKENEDRANAITAGLIIGTILVWILWDVLVAVAPGADTESQMLRNWGAYSMAFPYTIGMLLGHWWWPWRGASQSYKKTWRVVVNFSIIGALITWDIVNWRMGFPASVAPIRHSEYWAALGYPMGHFFWGQKATVTFES